MTRDGTVTRTNTMLVDTGRAEHLLDEGLGGVVAAEHARELLRPAGYCLPVTLNVVVDPVVQLVVQPLHNAHHHRVPHHTQHTHLDIDGWVVVLAFLSVSIGRAYIRVKLMTPFR